MAHVCQAAGHGAVPAGGVVGEENCLNPLFATHWAGKSDIVHLNSEPQTQFDLNLCRSYNNRASCCSNAFETEQQATFKRWVEHWQRVKDHLSDFQLDMEGLKVSRAYVEVGFEEKALFNKAFESFNSALDALGTCFDTLLEYTAGALCFACDPHWRGKVVLSADGTRVLSVRVHDSSNEEVWQSCREFAVAADRLDARVGDSALAKRLTTRFEDLDAFTSRIGIADFMARTVAALPMRGPSERVLNLEPPESVAQGQRRLQQPPSGDAPDAETKFTYPVRDGRASGFKCSVFPRKPVVLTTYA